MFNLFSSSVTAAAGQDKKERKKVVISHYHSRVLLSEKEVCVGSQLRHKSG